MSKSCSFCETFRPCSAAIDLPDLFDPNPADASELVFARLHPSWLKPHEVPYACMECNGMYVRYLGKTAESEGIWYPFRSLHRDTL